VVPLTPQGGLFVMADVRGLGLPDDSVRRLLLSDAGVIVIHGSAYGAGGAGTLRVSFAGGGAALDEGLKRLREGLQRMAKTVAIK
jgi:aspartate/methionine/tyrosine aminotransferase